jgi:hypothetical protein
VGDEGQAKGDAEHDAGGQMRMVMVIVVNVGNQSWVAAVGKFQYQCPKGRADPRRRSAGAVSLTVGHAGEDWDWDFLLRCPKDRSWLNDCGMELKRMRKRVDIGGYNAAC